MEDIDTNREERSTVPWQLGECVREGLPMRKCHWVPVGGLGSLGIEISHFLSLCPYICLEYIGNRRTRRDLGIKRTNNRRNISVEVLE